MSQLFHDEGAAANNGQKVCLATTAYESPDSAYTYSIQKTREYLHKAGIPTDYILLAGNCHVDDARNSVVQEFLLTDCTDLVFLDADVVWEPDALLKLCRFDTDLVGGIYPYRSEPNSKDAMPLLMYPGESTPNEQGLIEVAGLPTGFMRIRRSVLEKLSEKANKFWKKTDRRSQVPILFERTFFDGIRLGGDLSFCKKWVEFGGKCYAAPDLRLGHVVRSIAWDSLSAHLRRVNGTTLSHMVSCIKEGRATPELFSEVRRFIGNHFGALEDTLMLCALMGKKSDGPIVETGSGLTSVVLGASTEHKVYCLEHDPRWAMQTEYLLKAAGITNVEIVLCDIKNGWYDVPDGLPEFALGVNDGPPRTVGSRMGFFERFGYLNNIVCDDADDQGYYTALDAWCKSKALRLDLLERAAIIRKDEK